MAERQSAVKPTTVDEYLDAAPEAAQPVLRELREILRAAAPDAVEGLKWNQPAYSRARIVYCFGAFKDHANLTPTPDTLEVFREEAHAAGLDTTRGVLRIPYDVPLPTDLIRRIAEHRAAAEAAGAKFAV